MSEVDELLLEPVAAGVQLKVKASPGASRDRIVGVLGDALKVAVTAAPEKGKANKRILALLADALCTAPRDLTVLSGESTRDKRILISTLTAQEVRNRLGRALTGDR